IGLETNVHATFFDDEGHLWIGTIDGASRMDVTMPMPRLVKPAPTIVQMETALDSLPIGDGDALSSGQRGIHVEYAAVSLLNPKGIEYSYRMIGVDSNWSAATTNRTVNYPRIPPGPYQFMVRARYPGGEWSLAAASRSFTVQPFYWQQPWFIAISILSFLLVLRAVVLYRTRKMEWMNNTLRAQVEERTRSIELAKQSLERSNEKLSHEIEVRRKTEKARAEVETRFRRAFENAPIGMGLLDGTGSLFDANPALRHMLWTNGDASDLNFVDRIDDGDRERFLNDFRRLITSKTDSIDEKLVCHSDAGDELHTVANLSAVRTEAGSFLYAVLQIQDITEAQKLTAQLEYQASYDELTGLLNRRAFETQLKQAWERGLNGKRPSYLMYMDLDQFKVVNDTSGHVAGDQLLRAVSEILEEHVRANDIVARLGGDEFGIILWECPTDVAQRIAEAIRGAIEVLRFHWDDEVYRIGVSIGGVPIDPQVGDVNELQQLADAACYAAKEAGRNRVHMVAGDKDSARAHRGQVRWVQRLREAMDSNRFAIYAQPIKPLQEEVDEPERLEILLRLRDPETRKLIPPGAFLPAAERYGLSFELDQWVVTSLLDTLFVHQAFQAESRSYWINLSGGSIGDPHFAKFLTDAIDKSPLPPGTINFEITETAVIRSVNEAGNLMGVLREMGCQFALDDFGSGLSSFGYLKKLPVDFLKIDGMFIRDLLTDETDRIFVKSIIDIAHTLNIRTIAEFVENEEMLELVTRLGADYAQGFATGRPFVLAPRFSRTAGAAENLNVIHAKAG
ncbi:MAG: EAL domain-containing protein, partial [Woeseiaceae bacterium]|nr:EAL domain-containing protein [Woeseiaceae bacterium]